MHPKSRFANLTWRQFGQMAWWYLRQVTGDAAYENYLIARSRKNLIQSGGTCGNHEQPARTECGPARAAASERMSPEEFYLDALRRRYSGVSRCC